MKYYKILMVLSLVGLIFGLNSVFAQTTPLKAGISVNYNTSNLAVLLGTPITIKVRVTNLGSTTWTKKDFALRSHVYLSNGVIINDVAGSGYNLPQNVKPGATITKNIQIPTGTDKQINIAGNHQLGLDMVWENNSWFNNEQKIDIVVVGTSCVKNAVIKRENYISMAFNQSCANFDRTPCKFDMSVPSNFVVSITDALLARKTALANAWDIIDATTRNKAVKIAWSDYRKTYTSAKKAFNLARKSAWSQFNGDVKNCKLGISTSGLEFEGNDLSF